METTVASGLVGRVLADDVELQDKVLYAGDVLHAQDVKKLCAEMEKVTVYGGV